MFHYLAIIERGRLIDAGDPKLALSHFKIQRPVGARGGGTNTANALLDKLGRRTEAEIANPPVHEKAHSDMEH